MIVLVFIYLNIKNQADQGNIFILPGKIMIHCMKSDVQNVCAVGYSIMASGPIVYHCCKSASEKHEFGLFSLLFNGLCQDVAPSWL